MVPWYPIPNRMVMVNLCNTWSQPYISTFAYDLEKQPS
jgi:hypothetical protein